MPDANLIWSGDLAVTPAGDLSLVDGAALSQQRVLRRLLTNQQDYTWHPSYGGGLGQYVGSIVNGRAIEGAIRGQLFQEAAVAHQPEPDVTTSPQPDGSVFVYIAYSDVASGQTETLTFSVGV
jgi:hypothetical protein